MSATPSQEPAGIVIDESATDPAREAAARSRAAIDASCAMPCIAFFASSLFWLMVATVFAVLASWKMHDPELLADAAWLTFGRVRPAHLNAAAFGWASMAALGVLLWLMCRLCQVRLIYPRILVVACVLWNVGVAVGLYEILAGRSLGIEWLEFPTHAAFLLFMAFALVSTWALLTFLRRRKGHVYVSQWYLFGALFWFPWLYATVQILLILLPVRGVTQASINWWFGHNAIGLFWTPIGLAAAYYLIPKVVGRPIYSYHLSIFGFWTLALFYSWAGVHHLIAGPIPAWIVTVSIVGSMFMLIPVVTVALNHHMTMRGNFGLLRFSPTLRFVVFGAMSYTAVSIQGSLMSLRVINEPTHFTHYTIAHAHLGMYAFFTMVLFGSMYYIIPRLTNREWASSKLMRVHFWGVALGIVLMFVALSLGGLIQGLEMNNASDSLADLVAEHGLFAGIGAFVGGLQPQSGAVPFMETVEGTKPWLIARSVSGILLTVGHVAFFVLVVLNVHAWGRRRRGPTLFKDDPETYERLLAEGAAEDAQDAGREEEEA